MVLVLLAFGLLSSGCDREEPVEPTVAKVAQPITSGPCNFASPPPVGTPSNRTFSIKVPNGTTREEFALSTAGGVLTINDAVSVVKDSGGFASVASVEATNRLWLGVNAKAHHAFSELTGIELRPQAHLYGNATTASTVIRGTGSIVDGSTIQNTSLRPLVTTSWVVPFPGNTRGNCILQPDQTQIIDPGSYGTLTINARSKLTLRKGRYYCSGLASEADALLDGKLLAEEARSALERLPDLYREAFVLRDLEELETSEVAELLGVDAATVRQRVHRARLMLRGYLSHLVGAKT